MHVMRYNQEISCNMTFSFEGLQHVPPPKFGSQDLHSRHEACVASQPPSKPNFRPL